MFFTDKIISINTYVTKPFPIHTNTHMRTLTQSSILLSYSNHTVVEGYGVVMGETESGNN